MYLLYYKKNHNPIVIECCIILLIYFYNILIDRPRSARSAHYQPADVLIPITRGSTVPTDATDVRLAGCRY